MIRLAVPFAEGGERVVHRNQGSPGQDHPLALDLVHDLIAHPEVEGGTYRLRNAGTVLLTLGALGESACATAPGGVAAPTGEREADRASILAALEQVPPGGTVVFSPGTYLIGGLVRVTVPQVTLLGWQPSEFVSQMAAHLNCNGLELAGGQQTVRGLPFE